MKWDKIKARVPQFKAGYEGVAEGKIIGNIFVPTQTRFENLTLILII